MIWKSEVHKTNKEDIFINHMAHIVAINEFKRIEREISEYMGSK